MTDPMSQTTRCLQRLVLLAVLAMAPACGGGGGSAASNPRAQAPVIGAFTVSPTTITAARDIALSWSVTGADSLSISPGVGAVTGTTRSVPATGTMTYTLAATNAAGTSTATATVTLVAAGAVKIAYLHHSTGENVWAGGVSTFFTTYNNAHATQYQITSVTYPNTGGGYPWANYPYDYWNLWVNHAGTQQDLGELNLDQLAAQYDVIVFKHCFPVSDLDADTGTASVSSSGKRIENYKLQYAALKTRMNQFTTKKFILWTGAALKQSETTSVKGQRARDFFAWVKNTWNVPGDNIFIWDFFELETEGANFLKDAYASSDSHPNAPFCSTVAPYIGTRIVDVIEGRGDSGSITGH